MPGLNAQDASFLALETPDCPMHIGFLLTFKLPPNAPDDYMQRLHERLERHPVDASPFNLRLAGRPGLRKLKPEWETVNNVDLGYHLRHEALPWPGGERELGLAISRLHSQALERSRPLWECTLIEGLQPRHFALYVKIHHSLADGVAMMEKIYGILADMPGGESLPPWATPRHAPPAKPVQAADDDWRAFLHDVIGSIGKPKGAHRPGGQAIPHGPRCLLNGSTTGRRRFATQRLPLARVKAIAKAAECTVNDVLLAVCSGALRSYLSAFDQVPDEPLLATVPVAVPRAPGQTVGNAVASVHTTLASNLADPVARLAQIHAGMQAAKDEFNRIPSGLTRAINSVGMLAMAMLPRSGSPDPRHAAFTNLTISNVPGPKQTLYLDGAEMDGMYPVSVITGDHRLNITVLSYRDELFVGLIACPDTLPRMQRVAVALPQALDELETALQRAAAKAAAPAPAPAARRRRTAATPR